MRTNYFRHYRLFSEGSLALLPKGGVTLYIREYEAKDGSIDLAVTAAVCSQKDHYVKATGRKITHDRRRSKYEQVLNCHSRESIGPTLLNFAIRVLNKETRVKRNVFLSPILRNARKPKAA